MLEGGVDVMHLGLNILVSPIQPEALGCTRVNAQRSSDGIAVSASLQAKAAGKIRPFAQFALSQLRRFFSRD